MTTEEIKEEIENAPKWDWEVKSNDSEFSDNLPPSCREDVLERLRLTYLYIESLPSLSKDVDEDYGCYYDRVKEKLKKIPEMWCQSVWEMHPMNIPGCGTAACFAGWHFALHSATSTRDNIDYLAEHYLTQDIHQHIGSDINVMRITHGENELEDIKAELILAGVKL